MGRGNKTVARALARARAAAPGAVKASEASGKAGRSTGRADHLPPGEVETSLAARYHELKRQGARTGVDLAVELGQILAEARATLDKDYRAWVREHARVEPGTERNYLAMARFAREQPALVERHKELGARKLYRVARLPPESRAQVLRTPNLAALDDAAFQKVIEPHVARARKVTGNMRAHGLRQRVRSFERTVRDARLGRIDDPEMREGLVADLVSLRRSVDDLLKRVG